MTVGKEEARDSKRICPEADQTNTSIWPAREGIGQFIYMSLIVVHWECIRVSTRMFLIGFLLRFAGSGPVRFSNSFKIWSTLVEKRLREVRIPPFGPRLYCFMTSL